MQPTIGTAGRGCERFDDERSSTDVQILMDQHDTLSEHDGGYVLVWYRASGTEIRVVASRTVRARDSEITNWTNPGDTHHRSHSKEAQIPADQLRP